MRLCGSRNKMKDDTKLRRLWGGSLIAIGILTIILVGSSAAGLALPDGLRRIIGLLDLVALSVMGFASGRMLRKR